MFVSLFSVVDIPRVTLETGCVSCGICDITNLDLRQSSARYSNASLSSNASYSIL